MVHSHGRLAQEQALSRLDPIHAPPPGLAGQNEVINLGRVAPQGKLEAVFARQGAVAGAGITADLCQHGDDVVAEIPGKRLLCFGHVDLGGYLLSVDGTRDHGFPVTHRLDDTRFIDGRHLGIGRGEGRFAGQVADKLAAFLG
jgi:hypothetical protein